MVASPHLAEIEDVLRIFEEQFSVVVTQPTVEPRPVAV
jgi:hypothetical protein